MAHILPTLLYLYVVGNDVPHSHLEKAFTLAEMYDEYIVIYTTHTHTALVCVCTTLQPNILL